MITKEKFTHSLKRTYHSSGFRNAGRWFGLVYRSLSLSMCIYPDKDGIRKQRQELLAAWKEFVGRFWKEGEPLGQSIKTADAFIGLLMMANMLENKKPTCGQQVG